MAEDKEAIRLTPEEIGPYKPDTEQDVRWAVLDWDIDGLLQAQIDKMLRLGYHRGQPLGDVKKIREEI